MQDCPTGQALQVTATPKLTPEPHCHSTPQRAAVAQASRKQTSPAAQGQSALQVPQPSCSAQRPSPQTGVQRPPTQVWPVPHAGLQVVVGQAGDEACAVILWPASVQVSGEPLKRTANVAS